MSVTFQTVLTHALTPITLISGVGLVKLCMTTRYNHCADCVRQLIAERETVGLQEDPDLDQEISVLYERCSLLRRAMLCLALSTVSAGLLVALNVLESFWNLNWTGLSAALLGVALLLIIVSCVFFTLEVSLSLKAIRLLVRRVPISSASTQTPTPEVLRRAPMETIGGTSK